MKLIEVLESSAQDLFRKIDALNAVISDSASTENEKETAKKLKAKLEARLKTEFPDAKRPTKTSSTISRPSNGWSSIFWANMTKAAAEYKDREDRWKKNPEERKEYYKNRLRELQNKRKKLSTGRGIGNVELEDQYKRISDEIEKILRNEFPEEYQEILKKRETKAQKSAQQSYKKSQQKRTATKKAAHESGKRTFSEVGKDYKDTLKRFHNIMKQNEAVMWLSGYGNAKIQSFKNGGNTLQNLAYVKGLRNLWSQLSPGDREAIKKAVEDVNEFGHKAKGYTPAQKKKILDQTRSSKAPPRRK